MKTAFAHWRNRIAPVFDTAVQALVVETESGRVIGQKQRTLPEAPILQKILRLAELEVEALVCGAISRSMHDLLSAYGIEVIGFVAGDLDRVIQAWLGGDRVLDAFAMPGCQRRGRRRFRGMHPRYSEENAMAASGGGMSAARGKGQGRGGQRLGRMGGSLAAGPAGACVCPQCGHRLPHERGLPCVQRRCPKCGIAMTRQ